MHHRCRVVLAAGSGSIVLRGCSFPCRLTALLSQHWRSMIIAPDTKTLEWSFGFLFFTMAMENVSDATPWCLANTPAGAGGYGEGHVIRITSRPLAFKPLGEHSYLFDSCVIFIIIIIILTDSEQGNTKSAKPSTTLGIIIIWFDFVWKDSLCGLLYKFLTFLTTQGPFPQKRATNFTTFSKTQHREIQVHVWFNPILLFKN